VKNRSYSSPHLRAYQSLITRQCPRSHIRNKSHRRQRSIWITPYSRRRIWLSWRRPQWCQVHPSNDQNAPRANNPKLSSQL